MTPSYRCRECQVGTAVPLAICPICSEVESFEPVEMPEPPEPPLAA